MIEETKAEIAVSKEKLKEKEQKKAGAEIAMV